MSIRNIIDRDSKRLGKKKNVVAVGRGTKWIDGKDTGDEALLVFVKEKQPLSSLSQEDRIEKVIDGIPTDVVGKTGAFTKLPAAYSTKARPYQPGISCGHLWVTAGTIGGIFKDREGDLVILSNNHVLADENRAYRGHQTIQPGVYDGGRATRDWVATLKYFRPLKRPGQLSYEHYNRSRIPYNVEDSAISVVRNPDELLVEIKDIGVPTGWNDSPSVGMDVQKTGRTTGHTTGKITALDATVWVDYDTGVYEFRRQIITTDMSEGGDSGSLLVDLNGDVVGLLFAGSPQFTVHNEGKYPRTTYGLEVVNVTPIIETLNIAVIEDGVEIAQSHTPATLTQAIADAKSKARQGVETTITLNYNAKPDA